MCSDPTTRDGKTFACRTCNECISKRRVNWVARAMAEKATAKFSASLTLTYSDATQEGRDGARMFCYADIRNFLMRLRSAARYEAEIHKWGFSPQVRFIVAGEQGDRNGRCHWHLILFTNFDLSAVGKFLLSGNLLSHRSDMISEGKRIRRLNWSLWPLGYMTFQEPDLPAFNYVLSYCLKDQFTAEKSKGTMRHAKSENFATGLFRMSKYPPIGEEFLMRKLEQLHALGAVLPAPKLQIPGVDFQFEPRGSYREKLLWGLVAINNRILWATGANSPQWPSLVASVQPDSTDWKILHGLPQEDEDNPHKPDFVSIESRFAKRGRETAGRQASRDFANTCARALPCRDCLHALLPGDLQTLDLRREVGAEGVYTYTSTNSDSFDYRARQPLGRVNPFCTRRGAKVARLTAPKTGR